MADNARPPFRADHVGSLLRPKQVLQAREEFAVGLAGRDRRRGDRAGAQAARPSERDQPRLPRAGPGGGTPGAGRRVRAAPRPVLRVPAVAFCPDRSTVWIPGASRHQETFWSFK